MATYDVLLHGDTWDAKRGRASDQWLAIRDGVIEGIYEARPGEATVESECTLITPGLIDMHVHLVWAAGSDPVATLRMESTQELVLRAIENARIQLEHGVTTVRDLGSVDDIAITVGEGVRAGRVSGARIFASGRTIIISNGHDPFWGVESDGVEACRATVRELRGEGADWIKVSASGGVYGQAMGEDPGNAELSGAELQAIVDEADRFGLPVAAHAVGTAGISNAVDAGVRTIEHGNLMADDTLDALIERDIAYDPTLYVYREIAREPGSAPAYAKENAQRVVDRHWEVFETAIQRNARIIAGSDAGSPGTPHPSIHRELACLVEGGLTAEEALAAATLTNARELGRDELGLLDPGTTADVIGFSGDPIADINTLNTVTSVVSEGRPVSRLSRPG